MSDQVCTKDNPRLPFLCNCDACCRRAAHAWIGYMDRVRAGDLSLAEANALADSNPEIASRSGEHAPGGATGSAESPGGNSGEAEQ